MRTRLPWLSLVTVFVCFLVAANSSEDDFTCVAGNFTAGQRGNVTCHFGPDIHKAGYHFEIVRYPNDAAPSHSGEDVLRCHRLGDDVMCTTRKGFTFDEQIQANLTVIIPKVSKDQEGRYACQLIPPDNRKKRMCELNVREGPVSHNIIRQNTSTKTVLVLTVLVVLLPLLCGIIILYLLCRKNWKKLKELFCRNQTGRTATFYTNTRYSLLPLTKPKFPGDDEDTKRKGKRPYKVDIDLNYEVPDKHKFEDSEGYKRKYNDDAEERGVPYTVDIDLDYKAYGKSGADEKEGYKRKYFGDRYDEARERDYKVEISLNYEVEGRDETDEGYKPRKYAGDAEDEGRKPLKFTIRHPHHNEKDEETPHSVPHTVTSPTRFPRRPAWIKGHH